MISISLKQTHDERPSQVIDTLLEHKHLNRFFHATFSLLKTQDEADVSVGNGSISLVNMLGSQFQKQIITAEKYYVSYQIMGRKPVSHHSGDIYFYTDNHIPKLLTPPITEVSCNISRKAPWWTPDFVVIFFVKKYIFQALRKLAIYFKGDIE